jgi:pimeloyl-ACP methyl ester carboxylesterase
MSTVLLLPGFGGAASMMPFFCDGVITAGKTQVPVVYNNFDLDYSAVVAGAAQLDTAIHDFIGSGHVTIFGHSDGARVANYWLAQYGPTSTVPAANIDFVLLGDSVNRYGGVLYDAAANNTCPLSTPYTVLDFIRQYDGWADFPQDVTNQNAINNAMMGANNIHADYFGVTPSDAYVYSKVDGNVTHKWVMTYPVALAIPPFLASSYMSDLSWLNSSFEDQDKYWRPIIEPAYSRPVTIPTPPYA